MVKSSAKHGARSGPAKSVPKSKHNKPIKQHVTRAHKRMHDRKTPHLNGKTQTPPGPSPAESRKIAEQLLQAVARFSSAEVEITTQNGQPPAQNGAKPEGAFDISEKVKELVRLSKEQGYLTYNDINDALPDNIVNPDDLDEIYTQLHNLDVEIVDQAEVDVVKQPEQEEDENKEDAKMRLDILDDPVRMYLKQMGQVPLLTREQEVEICKRIEEAENQVKAIIYSFGFTGKEHVALADKLISEPPKERFDRVIVDKKIDSRDAHLKELRRLVKNVRKMDQDVDDAYAAWQAAVHTPRDKKLKQDFLKTDAR